MMEWRWARRIGPGLAGLGVAAVLATSATGARGEPWDPPRCAGPETAAGTGAGTWWRLDPLLDDGSLVGQRLAVGGPGLARPRFIDLGTESFAAGPYGGRVLVGTDDGRRSELSLIDVAGGCVRPLGTSTDVIRRAALTPDGTAVVEMRVDRTSRADLGVFRRRLGGDDPPARILDPIDPDPAFGPTWTTELAWSRDGDTLVVQSCGAIACRTRLADAAGRAVVLVADPGDGDLVGLADGRLVVHEACGGLPCGLVSIDVTTGSRIRLHAAAGQAVLGTGPDGRAAVIHEIGAGGTGIRSIGLDGRGGRALAPDPAGRRLVPGPARSGGAVEFDAGYVLFAPDGRLPLDGPLDPALRRLADGRTVNLEGDAR